MKSQYGFITQTARLTLVCKSRINVAIKDNDRVFFFEEGKKFFLLRVGHGWQERDDIRQGGGEALHLVE